MVVHFFLEEAVSLLMIGYEFFIIGKQLRSSRREEGKRGDGGLG
jgi:hypothetical protein